MALASGERVVNGFVVTDNGLAVKEYVNASTIVSEVGGLPRDSDGRLVVKVAV